MFFFFQESGGSFEFRVAPSELIIDPLNTPWMEGWKARGSLSYVSLIPTPGIANWHACACNRCAGRANPVRKYLELSLSPPPPTREGGEEEGRYCARHSVKRGIENRAAGWIVFHFFFLPLFSLSFFFPTSISTSIIFVLREKLTFFFMVLVREDLFPSDTNITCLVRNR